MKKHIHIILDIFSIWTLSALGFLGGFLFNNFAFWFWDALLSIYFLGRTYRWILFLYDKAFNKLCTVRTNNYGYSCSYPIYFLALPQSKLRYSEVIFNDPKLKGRFFNFEVNIFKSGDLLEMTYYKHSKVIKSIKKIE